MSHNDRSQINFLYWHTILAERTTTKKRKFNQQEPTKPSFSPGRRAIDDDLYLASRPARRGLDPSYTILLGAHERGPGAQALAADKDTHTRTHACGGHYDSPARADVVTPVAEHSAMSRAHTHTPHRRPGPGVPIDRA